MQFPPSIKALYPAAYGGQADRAALFDGSELKWRQEKGL